MCSLYHVSCPFLYILITTFKAHHNFFYIALSQSSILTRNRISAGVLKIRRRNIYTRGRASQKFLIFFEKISQCWKLSHSAEKTLIHILIHALPILIHRLGFRFSAPYLNTCITYLNTLSRLLILIHALPILIHWVGFRLSAPYLNTLPNYTLS